MKAIKDQENIKLYKFIGMFTLIFHNKPDI